MPRRKAHVAVALRQDFAEGGGGVEPQEIWRLGVGVAERRGEARTKWVRGNEGPSLAAGGFCVGSPPRVQSNRHCSRTQGLAQRFSCSEAEAGILEKVPRNFQCCRNLGPIVGQTVSAGSWEATFRGP